MYNHRVVGDFINLRICVSLCRLSILEKLTMPAHMAWCTMSSLGLGLTGLHMQLITSEEPSAKLSGEISQEPAACGEPKE